LEDIVLLKKLFFLSLIILNTNFIFAADEESQCVKSCNDSYKKCIDKGEKNDETQERICEIVKSGCLEGCKLGGHNKSMKNADDSIDLME
jgi:hypothetical protein